MRVYFSGILPEDAPDPREQSRRRLRDLPFPVMGLVEQAAIEDHGDRGFMESTDASGIVEFTTSTTYTLWRNPSDKSDPVNLAELDEVTRAALENVPPWPRPAWLVESVERMRYPALWECVQTSWSRHPTPHSSVEHRLVAHANHTLVNHFRRELGLPPGPTTDHRWQVTPKAIDPRATIEIDGSTAAACQIDTDPFIYAIGARVSPEVVATVVVSRDHLPLLDLALQTQQP